MTTTHKTPWAAGFGDRPMATGNTIDEVVNDVLLLLIDELDRGFMEPDDVDGKPITVYRDVTWCVGNDGEDCDCGGNHADADGPWLLMGFMRRGGLPVVVIRPATEDGDFDVLVVGEVTP